MATNTTTPTQSDARRTGAGAGDADRPGGVGSTARQVADTVAGAAGEMTARLPEVAQSTRDAVGEATAMLDTRSDRTLEWIGIGLVGFALGLFAGGAARLLVLLALVPTALIGATLLDRHEAGVTPRKV